jgi:predicted Fe-Mo cluster-binding NifX family protein
VGQTNNLKNKEMMKITLICIPSQDERGLLSNISMHFGKTPYLTYIKLEDGEIKDIKVIESFGKHMGGSSTPAQIILGLKVDVLICGNLGSKAISMLNGNGMDIFSGASGKVKDALSEWKIGNLSVAGDNSCDKNDCEH